MKNKRLFSIIFVVIGLVLTIYGINTLHRISEAKKDVTHIHVPFTGHEIGVVTDHENIENASGENDAKAIGSLVGGLVLLLIGAGYLWKHKKR